MKVVARRLERSLDIARGLAALWVFVFHIRPIVEMSMPSLAPLAAIGSNGVLLFFVISGYCIHSSASRLSHKGVAGVGMFLNRRLRRVYPPFWCSIGIVVVLPFLVSAISMLKSGVFEWPLQAAWAEWRLFDWLGLITLSRGLATGDSGDGAFNAVQAVYWTLAVEIQFYLVVALAMLTGRLWHVVLWVITVGAVAAVALRIPLPGGIFLPFWPHFVFGMVLHIVHERTVMRPGDDHSPVVAIALVGSCLLLIACAIYFLGRPKDYAFSAMCAVVLWLSGYVECLLSRRWANRDQHHALRTAGRYLMTVPLALGACSYSIYLLHGKLYQVPAMFARQIFPPDSVFHALFVIALTCALCYPFYLFAERPFIGNRRFGEK